MTDDPVDMTKVLDATERGQVDEDGLTLDLTPLENVGAYPWERMPGEPNLWFDRFFKYYLKQGSQRNIREANRRFKAAETGKKHTGQANASWTLNAHRWNWQVRAEAYDEHQRILDHIKWEGRRTELREKEWGVSTEMLDLAKGHLNKVKAAAKQAQPEVPAGNRGRVQIPRAAVKNLDAARFAELGSKLGRLATGMATDQIAVNVQVRMEEVRKKRWDSAMPQLQQILDDEEEDIVEGEVVDEPPEEASNDDESAN